MPRIVPLTKLVGVALIATVATAIPVRSLGPGKLDGKVENAVGRGVKGITLRFVREDGDLAREVSTGRNGRFGLQGLAPGRYSVEVVDGPWFIASLAYEVTSGHGLTVSEGRMDGRPDHPAGPVPFNGRDRLRLTVVVADRASDEADDRSLAFVAREINAAVKAYEKGKFDRVVELTAAIIAENPDMGEAHYMQGIALQGLGNATDAVPALERAVQRIPDHPGIWGVLADAMLDRAEALEQEGQDDAARDAYRRAAEALSESLEREPATPGALIDLAKALDEIGAVDRLVPVLERILSGEPDDVQARLRLAALCSDRGDHDRALELVREIPTSVERAAVTIYNIAVQLNDDGDPERSLWAAKRAAEIDPDLPHPQRLIVQLAIASGDHATAAEAIRRFVELAPDDPETDTYRRILEQIGEP